MSVRPLILVVEDDIPLAETTCDILESAGARAEYRSTVAEAIAYLGRHSMRVSGLMTDINLASPMTGVELAVYVSEEWPAISICVTSGVVPQRPMRLPDSARFIAKPWQVDDLVSFAEALSPR